MFATVQNLGLNLVVFGIGQTAAEAETDAVSNGLANGTTVEVDDRHRAEIEAGKTDFAQGELSRPGAMAVRAATERFKSASAEARRAEYALTELLMTTADRAGGLGHKYGLGQPATAFRYSGFMARFDKMIKSNFPEVPKNRPGITPTKAAALFRRDEERREALLEYGIRDGHTREALEAAWSEWRKALDALLLAETALEKVGG